MKKLTDYKLIICDLDGTLYFQKPFRMKMAEVILTRLILRPSRWKEVRVILFYRKLRENWKEGEEQGRSMTQLQFEVCAEKLKMKTEEVQGIIRYWMEEEPLTHLRAYRDEQAAELISKLAGQGIKTVIYSDYPVAEKLNALDIRAEGEFFSGQSQINCMKPDPKGIRYILETMGMEKKDALMVGDRMEKDGEAAKAAGIDYFILSTKKKERSKQYSKLVL